MSANPLVFTFGIEMEIYLRPNFESPEVTDLLKRTGYTRPTSTDHHADRDKTKNRTAVLRAVADLLTERGVSAVVDKDVEDEYTEWQIKGDSSLYLKAKDEYCQYQPTST